MDFESLGFQNGGRIPNFYNSLVACAICLLVSYGGRVGEFLPPRTGNRIPLRPMELKKCTRFSQLTFWLRGSPPCTLGSVKTRKQQIDILFKARNDHTAAMVLFLIYTKNKKHMAIYYCHFHIFGSPLLCPVCVLSTALLHRLLTATTPVTHSCFVFSIITKKGYVPFATPTFTKVLQRVAEANAWYKIRYHDFRRGLLTWMWYGSECFFVPERILHFLGNHTVDYCKQYLYPELKRTFRLVNTVREFQIRDYLKSLPSYVAASLRAAIFSFPGRSSRPEGGLPPFGLPQKPAATPSDDRQESIQDLQMEYAPPRSDPVVV